MKRRNFLKNSSITILSAGVFPIKTWPLKEKTTYFHQGKYKNYKDFQIIEDGQKIVKIETFTRGPLSLVKVTTDNGKEGWGQISTYDNDISVLILHRKIAHHFLGKDPAKIDELIDKSIEHNHKFPWSFINRALAGIDTAIWDLYGKIKEKPVVELLGGKPNPLLVYGSSMRRDITSDNEAKRLLKLQQEDGFKAFKIRIGSPIGRNKDASPGRTEKIVPTVRKAIGWDTDLLVDANSCYTPDRAIEVGRMLEQNRIFQFEEPCPWWELEWTKEVTDAVNINVSGGEQDNELAHWRRMINMKAVNIIQPDPLYLGGITRTYRVAKMAEVAGLSCVPHSANHSLVTLFAMHLLGAIPNAEKYLEYSIEFDAEVNKHSYSMYEPHLKVIEGFAQIPAEPGWGIKIKNEWLEKANYQISKI